MEEELQQKETDMGLLRAGVEILKKEKMVAEDARKVAESSEAEMKLLLIAERKKSAELVGAVGQAKGEEEKMRKELELAHKARDDAVVGREHAVEELRKLRAALPELAQKIMDSEPVSDKFNHYLDCALDHERNKVIREVMTHYELARPWPCPVRSLVKEDTASILLAAEQDILRIEIPKLNNLVADPNVSIDQLLSEKL